MSTSLRLISINLGRVVTSVEGLSLTKPDVPLITWSREKKRYISTFIIPASMKLGTTVISVKEHDFTESYVLLILWLFDVT